MTFAEAVADLWAKHPKAKLSSSVKSGAACTRAAGVTFKNDKGGMYSGKDTDGTEVPLYFNDTANVPSRTEIESDLGPDEVLVPTVPPPSLPPARSAGEQ